MRRAPGAPPTEDVDKLSATNSEVESAMNHRRRRTVLHDACFSQEALDAFNSGDAHLRAAQDASQSHGAVCKRHTGEKIW